MKDSRIKDFIFTFKKSLEKKEVTVLNGANSKKYIYEVRRLKRNQIFKK